MNRSAIFAAVLLVLCSCTVMTSADTLIKRPPKPITEGPLTPDQVEYFKNHPKEINARNPFWNRIKCWVCKEVIGHMIDFVVDHGCDLADPIAAAACAIAGPFEPLCAAALIEGCSIIVEDVVDKHIMNHVHICKDIHMC